MIIKVNVIVKVMGAVFSIEVFAGNVQQDNGHILGNGQGHGPYS